MAAHKDQFSEYQNGVTKQMEVKDGQIEELYSKLRRAMSSACIMQ